jgi:hypothetical protein
VAITGVRLQERRGLEQKEHETVIGEGDGRDVARIDNIC